jgi:predicted DNA-binding WGR domain protein
MAFPRIFAQDGSARHRIRAMNAPALELRRIDAARNMRRFYRLDVQPDLFGGFLLVRQWGRIGARGRIVAERFDHVALAAQALAQHAARKARRGYSNA